MSPTEYRIKYSTDLARFLATPAGQFLQLTLSRMRPNNDSDPLPIAGVDLNQLLAADAMKKRGYEIAVSNLMLLSTLPAPIQPTLTQKYAKKPKEPVPAPLKPTRRRTK